jgi:Icc-related predicted phosphoesterase
MRIFLAADPHGSQQTWEKMCRAPKVFKADVAMMCGDLTGKAIMPIIQEKEDRWYAQPHGSKKTFKKQKDLDKFVKFTEVTIPRF